MCRGNLGTIANQTAETGVTTVETVETVETHVKSSNGRPPDVATFDVGFDSFDSFDSFNSFCNSCDTFDIFDSFDSFYITFYNSRAASLLTVLTVLTSKVLLCKTDRESGQTNSAIGSAATKNPQNHFGHTKKKKNVLNVKTVRHNVVEKGI